MSYPRPGLEEAASAITGASLDAAKEAIREGCREYLELARDLSIRLDEVFEPRDLRRFARALALTELGALPTRPETCPFCIQYSRGRECTGCGYAITHGGRCDADTSAFAIFIEAFQELGRSIFQDMEDLAVDPKRAREELKRSIDFSVEAAEEMLLALEDASAVDLMEAKALYLMRSLDVLPVALLSCETRSRLKAVREALEDYW